MELVLANVIGVIIGSIITGIIVRLRPAAGTLRIDRTNPKKDIYRMEFNMLDDLPKKKRISLKVDSYADLSQK